jgi:hypothetical protein
MESSNTTTGPSDGSRSHPIEPRIATRELQMINKDTKGYCWHKLSSKWQSQIQIGYKKIHLGLFDTKEEAEQKSIILKDEYDSSTDIQNKHMKEQVIKATSWYLGYHKREINKLNKTLAYHNHLILVLGFVKPILYIKFLILGQV